MDKAERLALKRAVKLHIFMPSNRMVWTVVGSKHEYWVHPPDYCTCKDYYFRARTKVRALEGKEEDLSCYHLNAVKIAESLDVVDKVHFHDDEYDGFVMALVDMIHLQVTKGS